MGQLVKIQSVSDVITNSSSEVYCIKATETFKETFKGSENLFSAIFLTEQDIKNYLLESDYWEIESTLEDVLENNPLGDSGLWDYAEDAGRTKEEVIDFFFPCYKCLLGYAIFTCEDTYNWDLLKTFIGENKDKDGEEILYAHT